MKKTLLLALTVVSLFFVMTVGCGDPNACAPKEVCACTGQENCIRYCTGADCKMSCSGQGNCNFKCDQGKCTFEITGQGTATLDCKGGGCDTVAKGQGTTVLTCAGGNCKLICGGTSNCSIKGCTKGCSCEENGVSATCG